ncbi:MAG: ATP-dependent helicase [Caldilineaceae bacterium]
MTAPFFTTANEQQRQAIETVDGPLLIIAGPGSGKTFTLVERVVYLVTERKVDPASILVVTFTDKAAHELTMRIAARLGSLSVQINLDEMYLGTFHAICARWLNEYREHTRLARNHTTLDEFDQHFFIYRAMRAYEEIPGIQNLLGNKGGDLWKKAGELKRWLNTAREEMLTTERLAAADDPNVRVLGLCLALYESHLSDENTLDFAAIQCETYNLLRSHPHVRANLRERIQYLLVDEYQDTNTIQEALLFAIARDDSPNFCVVGDDDQGLYRFRGATIRNILEFKQRFAPGVCREVTLTVNYRSHPAIIAHNNGWMERGPWQLDGRSFRHPKRIEPQNGAFPNVPAVLRVSGANEREWHEQVLAFLHSLRAAGTLTDWNQVAFLFYSLRYGDAPGLANFLERNGIPVYAPRSNQFFDRLEVRLAIGALIYLFPQFHHVRVAFPGHNDPVWNYYDHQCLDVFKKAVELPENADLLAWISPISVQHAKLDAATPYGFSALFYQLIQFPLFARFLNREHMQASVATQRPMRNLALLSRVIARFELLYDVEGLDPATLDRHLRGLFNQFLKYLMESALREFEDSAEYAPSGSVSFLTIHQAKGLEFPVVIVGSLDVQPSRRDDAMAQALESCYLRPPIEPAEWIPSFDMRRLFYTAFSRAQNLLVLTWTQRSGYKACPSSFFLESVEELMAWNHPAVRLAELPLSPVPNSEVRRAYSFTTDVLQFEECAEQYRFFRALDFKPVRSAQRVMGEVVHQTIEDMHKAVLRGDLHHLTDVQVAEWLEENFSGLARLYHLNPPENWRHLARENVLRYLQQGESIWTLAERAEVRLSHLQQGYILSGKVDLICRDGDGVEIIDFKTERKPDANDPEAQQRLARYRRQVEVYAWLVEQRTGQAVTRTRLYYTSERNGDPWITFPHDRDSIAQTISGFDAVVQRIEARDFTMASRPTHLCPRCDLRVYCDKRPWNLVGE